LVWFFTQTKLGQEIWKNFTKFLGEAWSFLWNSVLKPVFEAIGAIFTWLWNNILKPYIALIINEVKVLGAIFNWLWNNIISPVANWIGGAIKNVGTVIALTFGGIAGVVSGAFSTVHNIIRGVMNSVVNLINGGIGGINTLIRAVNSIPGISIPSLGRLPQFADGVQNFAGGLAVVGERGPEIVKLPGGSSVYPTGTGPAMASRGTAGGGGVTIVLQPQGLMSGTPGQLAQQLVTIFTNAARSGQIPKNALSGALTGS
jgi:phage-related protein